MHITECKKLHIVHSSDANMHLRGTEKMNLMFCC